MGVSRGRAPAAGFFTTTDNSQTAQGQRARERSLFLLLLPSADASGFARRGGWERPNRSSVLGWWRADPKSLLLAPARGPGPESQVRPILIFARHCLLPDIGHRFRASAALFTELNGVGAASRRSRDHGRSRPAQSRTEGGGRAGMLCGSLGLAGGRILRGTAPKARRDGANASFFWIRASVYIQAEL